MQTLGTVGIIGGSVAGLLAARVLSTVAERVILFDRDAPSTQAVPRKSVPQDTHAHVLLTAGAQALGEWFPDLFDGLASAGGLCSDMSASSNWFHFDTWKRRFECGVPVHFQSRPLLEYEIYKRVVRLGNVQWRQSPVRQVSWTAGAAIRLEMDTEPPESVDFLVDASGRGSKMATWLKAAGFEPARSEEARVEVSYVSARYRPREARDWQGLLIYPTPPKGRRAGGVLPVEGGEVVVSLFGWCGERPEPTDAAMLQYARCLPRPEIADLLIGSDRLSKLTHFSFNKARRLHYPRLRRFPANTCVLGDALCSLDPVFGQGMTAAALTVQLLEQIIQENKGDLSRVSESFRKRSLQPSDAAWVLSTGEDYRYPEVSGRRPLGLAFSHWYTRHIHQLAARDEDVYRRFARVMHLLAPPTTLLHPSVVRKVLAATLVGSQQVRDRPRGES